MSAPPSAVLADAGLRCRGFARAGDAGQHESIRFGGQFAVHIGMRPEADRAVHGAVRVGITAGIDDNDEARLGGAELEIGEVLVERIAAAIFNGDALAICIFGENATGFDIDRAVGVGTGINIVR